MDEAFRELLIGCLGALITAVFTYRSDKKKVAADREDIYADHTEMLWKKIDDQSKVIDKLTTQVEDLRTENAKLVNQVKDLTSQVTRLSKGVKK
jgi:septal ring factor EnvC (AmiA/AmiB activator)